MYEVSNSGLNGKEAAPADEPAGGTWDDYAASIASKMVNGCSDWYMPDIAELRALYAQQESIGGFADDDYWSLTEEDQGADAIQKYFGSIGMVPSVEGVDGKNSIHKARAIRAF